MSARWKLGEEILQGTARRRGSSLSVTNADGVLREFQIRPNGDGGVIVQDGTTLRQISWARDGEKLWVFHAGRTWELDLHREGSSQTGPSARDAVVAPMTGTLLALEVQPGDLVEKDQVLGVIEAMKMQCDLKAPRAGTVHEVPYRPGDQVPGGAVIVALEEDSDPS